MIVRANRLVLVTVLYVVGVALSAGSALAQTSDTTPPQLTSLSFSPAAVDVSTGPQLVTVDATLSDNLSGVAGIQLQFVSPSGAQVAPVNLTGLSRISGTFPFLTSTHRATIEIPRFSEAGTWRLSVVRLVDNVGNQVYLSASDLAALGFPTNLVVASTPDTQAPTVTSIGISPSTIDVSAADRNITFSLGLADNASGVSFDARTFYEFRVGFRSPSGRQHQFLSRNQFVQTSGDSLDGVWQATASFPRYSEAGIWTVSQVLTIDFAGNRRAYSTQELQAAGLATSINILSSLSDIQPPQVTGLTFSPNVINTTTGAQSVLVTLHISDDLSGTSFASETPGATYTHGIEFRSPSGAQTRIASFTLAAGTTLNGTWVGTVFFPQFSESGTWKASLLGIKDTVANTVNYSTTQLANLGMPTDLTVFLPSGAADGQLTPAGGTVSDVATGGSASVTFPPGALLGATNVAIDVLTGTNSPVLPVTAGFSAGTLFVNVELTPTPPMPFASPGVTVTLPFASFQPPGSAIHLFRLDPVTGSLIPAVSVTGGNVVGTVDSTGLRATFSGVSRLSTIAGLFPIAVLGDVNSDGAVTCDDIAAVRASFGKRSGQAGSDARADINGDGLVNVSDLALVSRQLPANTTC